MYLDSTGIESESDFWLTDSGVFFHITPHREWFYEYERYNGNVFMGDDSPKKITWRGRVKLLLNDGRTKTLPDEFHIPSMARNLIFVNKMANAVLKLYLKKIYAKWFEEQ